MPALPSPEIISTMAPLQAVAGCLPIMIHQADDPFALWLAWEAECGSECPIPFWAVVWPAAQVMSRYLLEHHGLVAGKHLLDLGSGCGIVAIAAALAGARQAVANDIDPASLWMAQKNAEANRAAIRVEPGNFLSDTPGLRAFDIICVADMFYQKQESLATVAFLNRVFEEGGTVLIADGGRPFSPRNGLTLLEERVIAVNFEVEGVSQRMVRLFQVTGALG